MMLSITKAVKEVLRARFKQLLCDPEMAKVEYSQTGNITSYNLNEYSLAWAKYAKVADILVKRAFSDDLGIFTRKRSKDFIKKLEIVCSTITATDVINSEERFRTWMD